MKKLIKELLSNYNKHLTPQITIYPSITEAVTNYNQELNQNINNPNYQNNEVFTGLLPDGSLFTIKTRSIVMITQRLFEVTKYAPDGKTVIDVYYYVL